MHMAKARLLAKYLTTRCPARCYLCDHYCPAINRLGSRVAEGPVKWAFSQKAFTLKICRIW